jgi:hypothetical protein
LSSIAASSAMAAGTAVGAGKAHGTRRMAANLWLEIRT